MIKAVVLLFIGSMLGITIVAVSNYSGTLQAYLLFTLIANSLLIMPCSSQAAAWRLLVASLVRQRFVAYSDAAPAYRQSGLFLLHQQYRRFWVVIFLTIALLAMAVRSAWKRRAVFRSNPILLGTAMAAYGSPIPGSLLSLFWDS